MKRQIPGVFPALLVTAGLTALTACVPGSPTPPTASPSPAARKPAPATPRDAFLVKCSKCHEAERAYAEMGGKNTWPRLVAEMALKDPAWLTGDDVRMIIAYREAHAVHVENLFRAKCGSCHQSLAEMRKADKSSAQWKTMVNFMGQRSPGGLTREEAEALTWGLVGW